MLIATDNNASPPMQRVVLLVEYCGCDFSGSQFQTNASTVQEAVQIALQQLNIVAGPVTFSGRTDAGVNAKGQVAHFDIPLDALKQVPNLLAALNATLADTVSVKDYTITQDFGFHSTASAEWRWYQYRIYNGAERTVWMPRDTVHIKPPLDVERMQRGARYFLGEQNFESFKCLQADPAINPVCRVIHSQVYREGDEVVFDIVANRFLYKMVRNIMGLLIEIGSGADIQPENIPSILEAKDRRKAGATAKPQGLSLMAVHYPKPWDYFQSHVYVTTLNQRIQESSSNEKNIFCKAS
jgi:tRNA pseudouridine38-40 synthase